MFDDLLAAATAKSSLIEADPYFLGSIVLVKPEGQTGAEIIDGQQRLTTLTILLAALRERSKNLADDINERIFQKGSQLKGTKNQPRLRIRSSDQPFFEKYVQKTDRAMDQEDLVVENLPTESWRNSCPTSGCSWHALTSIPPTFGEALAQFIELHTYLVVVATQDFESAYRIFTVLNERGLDLSHTDILKAEIIGQIPDVDKDAYTTKWQAEEDDLDRDGFADLFVHIRMVFAMTKARESILKEFRTSVLSKFPERGLGVAKAGGLGETAHSPSETDSQCLRPLGPRPTSDGRRCGSTVDALQTSPKLDQRDVAPVMRSRSLADMRVD